MSNNTQPPARRVRRRGSLLPTGVSAAASDNQDQPEPGRRRSGPILAGENTGNKRRPYWHVMLRNGLWAIAIVVLAWVLFGSHWLDVRGVEIGGNTEISQTEAQHRLEDYLNQRPLERNILFTRTSELARALKSDYPTINKLNINRTIFLKLHINAIERKAVLVWQTGGSRWVVAEDGIILRPAKEGEAFAGTILDTANLPVKAGDQVANRQFISFVHDVYAKAKDHGFTIQRSAIESTTRELKVTLDSGIYIRFDTTREAGEQLAAAQDALEAARKNNKPPREYLDVRIPGRVYYR